MRHLIGAAVLTASFVAEAGAVCPPPPPYLHVIQSASSVSLVRLGSRALRSGNPLESGRFLGFEPLQSTPLGAVAARAAKKAFGRSGSYACKGAVPKDPLVTQPAQVGLEFESDRGRVRVGLQLPERLVQLEFMNGALTEASLNESGASEWLEVVRTLVPPGAGPEDFYVSIREAADTLKSDARAADAAPFDTLELDLEAVTRVDPVYPELARSAGVDGTVFLRVLVGPDGKVRDGRVIQGIEMLNQAAREAVLQWRFSPPRKNGAPVLAWTTVAVRFSMR